MAEERFSPVDQSQLIWVSVTFLVNIISNIFAHYFSVILTYFSSMFHFYTPWKRQKAKGFMTFSEV